MGSSKAARALGLAALALLAAQASRSEALYLHVVPLEVERGAELGAPLVHVRLHVRHPERLGALIGATAQQRGDALEIALSENATLSGEVEERYRRPSFVLDYDEPALEPLRAALLAEQGPAPSLEALRAFTGRAIARKTMERGWDLASVVAQSGVGDCTEHAVLLAALARSVGRPARVVVGVLLAETQEGVLAFGHAWAEIHDEGAWRRVDATPVAESGRVRYLPLFALEDEGPGYGMALASATQALWVREIELRAR